MKPPRARPLAALAAALLAAALAARSASADAARWPLAAQVGAPSINSASPDLLDRATFPARAGFAWDERVSDSENRRAMTLSITPEAARWLLRPKDEPAPGSPWERAALRVTLGGPLQFVDSLRAGQGGRALDHVTSELKLRLLEREDATRDRGTTVALALGADNVGTGFGLDRYGATLIAERDAPCVWTANAGYRILERYQTLHRMAETKLGLGTQWRLDPEWRNGTLGFGVSGACLVRNRSRPPVWQSGAALDIQAADGLRLTLAARRSDRTEIRGDARMREVVSLSYAF